MANYTKDSDIIIEDRLLSDPYSGITIPVRPALVIFETDDYITEILLSRRLILKSTKCVK